MIESERAGSLLDHIFSNSVFPLGPLVIQLKSFTRVELPLKIQQTRRNNKFNLISEIRLIKMKKLHSMDYR
jgi:hypothetical protein